MEKQNKQYINEWKSINNNVKLLAEYISNRMWDISKTGDRYFDSTANLMYVDGSFKVDLNEMFENPINEFGIEEINVEYKLYFVDSIEEYNQKLHIIGNSEADFENKTLHINAASIEGYFNYTITQEIFHEIEHMFQYGMGLEKREKLYDRVIYLLYNLKTDDEFVMSILKLIYMTFAHEQDAFANQYYGILTSEIINGSFEETVSKLPNYIDFRKSFSIYMYNRNEKKDEANKLLSELGMTLEQFNKRIHFGKKRLLNKLKNVYERHMIEMNRFPANVKNESKRIMVRNMLFNEIKKRYPDIKIKEQQV